MGWKGAKQDFGFLDFEKMVFAGVFGKRLRIGMVMVDEVRWGGMGVWWGCGVVLF